MLQISVLTPEKRIYSGTAILVEVPGAKGRFQMLVNHAPIVSDLVKGEIRIVENINQEIRFKIQTGLVECSNNQISILIES